MTTIVTCEVNWEGRDEARGNVIHGWWLGTVVFIETECDDGPRFEVFVRSHNKLVNQWRAFRDFAEATRYHADIVTELKSAGDIGPYAVPFESCADELVDDDGDVWGDVKASCQIPEAKRVQRCAKCWKGAGCKCSEPELVRDVLARVMPVHMAAVGGEDLRRRK